MNLEILVSTMNQSDHSLINKMNIQSDAIIINQCDRNDYEELQINNNRIRLFSFNERGVGLSRNSALMRATGDICLFADDDVVYEDGYKEKIIKAFEENPRADIIVFNVPSTNIDRPAPKVNKEKRLFFHNCLKYGAVTIAVKMQKLYYANVYFSLLFGGGAKYGSGEDSLFLIDCLKRGLKVYTHPNVIGYVKQEDSTWFNGYTDKFFYDKGALFAAISKKWSKPLCVQFILRHHKSFDTDIKMSKALRLMIRGAKEFSNN